MDDPLRAALEYLANPESWGGDPHEQGATLYGHDTPFELAGRALAHDDGRCPARQPEQVPLIVPNSGNTLKDGR